MNTEVQRDSQPAYEDNFSRQAGVYARHRPQYPAELYSWLASQVSEHSLAWDCGTGNGQAAVALAEFFDAVIATDASPDQISHAIQHPRVSYRVAFAEQSGLPDASVDLVTVATALHWFELDDFYREVHRVVKPGGLLAVWGYYDCRVTPEIDAVVMHFTKQTLNEYWSDRIKLVNNYYRTIPFPFEEVASPDIDAVASWNLNDMVGFIESWSAVQTYRQREGHDPLELVREKLRRVWGDPEHVYEVRWKLHFRIGRIV